MNQDIMKRAMFAMPLSKQSRNAGIMQGFEDDMEMMEEPMGDEMMPMERTPQNPEILMNTLRGDMRSVDARYAELAGMVGEEAAMETPPEVLAILQDHFAMMEQPQGIGALPQGGEMMPPMMPAQGQGPMPMDQGPMGGMEGMPPFPPGGSEGAPPTPDGLPPAQMAIGGIASVGSRFLPYMAATGAALRGRINEGTRIANETLGRMFMQPQPVIQQLRGPGYDKLVTQARNTMVPGAQPGTMVSGTGTKLVPYTSLGMRHPTFTQGLGQGLGQAYRNFASKQALVNRLRMPLPRIVDGKAQPYTARQSLEGALQLFRDPRIGIPAAGSVVAELYGLEKLADYMRQSGEGSPAEMPYIPDNRPETMALGRGEYGFGRDPEGPVLPMPEPMPAPASTTSPAAAEQEAAGEKPVPIDIWEGVDKQPNWIIDTLAATAKPKAGEKSKSDRIKASYGEYLPLFKELIGEEDKDSLKTNALLLLADAGFKLASSTQPTMAMAIGEAFQGLPRGLAALANDAKERGIKIKTAALEQSIGDITQEDKEAAAVRLAMIRGDYQLLKEQAKALGKTQGQVLTKDGGAGLVYLETKDGSYLGQQAINPDDSTFRSAVSSKYTLQPTSNPFVEYRGPAASTIETDKAARLDLVQKLRTVDDTLREVEQIEGVVKNLYGPGAWASDIYNNVFVPVSAGAFNADLVTERSKATLLRSANIIAKNFASIGDSGRVAVQEQEWARKVLGNLLKPTDFFGDTKLASASVSSTRAALLNARQQILTQLGYANQDLMAVAPPTGTEDDPFIVPKDEGDANQLYNFLKQTVAKDPKQKGTVFLNINGKVVPRSLESIRSRGVQ